MLHYHTQYSLIMHEARPESIQLLWISRESVTWPWCNLAASQVTGDLTVHPLSLSSGATQSAVRRRWLSLCTVWPSNSQWPSEQISESASMRLPILQLSCRLFFWQNIALPRTVNPHSPDLAPCDFWFFLKAKISVESEKICECDGHTIYKLSQRRLTADWLDPRENDCSRVRSKVSSDWLPSYTKATLPVLEILKMAGYFPDRPRNTNVEGRKSCAFF
jgi:hypothetical protein